MANVSLKVIALVVSKMLGLVSSCTYSRTLDESG